MSNGFDFFEGTTSEGIAPRITVRKGGQLVLTSGAVQMLGDDVECVQLAYDARRGIVGIRAASEGAKGRYRLRIQKSGSSRLVTGKRFFKHHGLSIEKARTFDAQQFDGGIVGFQFIDKPAETKAETRRTSSRRKARAAA